VLLLIGLAFKVAAVPFHFWAPDVYEGAPTPVTGFMAVAVKSAAFAGWIRIVMHQLSPLEDQLSFILWAIAILTMTVGNLLALTQSSVKRMLAYSSIAHAGYLLIGLIAGNDMGGAAVLFYMLVYTLMTLGAFGVLMALQQAGKENDSYQAFAGIGFKHRFLALAMSIFMLSLAGFPPFGGFTGKFYLFRSAVESGHTVLAVIAVLNSVLSVAYYLRVIVMMYMQEGRGEAKPFRRSPYLYTAIAITALGILWLGVAPDFPLELSRISIASLR
jgi:NADH-quinone oxidoreductase subunit N